MCHLSLQLSNMFDPNSVSSSDQIMVKLISVNETLLKVGLEPKGQGRAKGRR